MNTFSRTDELPLGLLGASLPRLSAGGSAAHRPEVAPASTVPVEVPARHCTASEQERELDCLIRGVYMALQTAADSRLKPLGLSYARARTLLAIHRARGPMTQVALSRLLGISGATLVRLLDGLVTSSWVQRKACTGNRRAFRVDTTPAGRALCGAIEHELSRMMAEIFGGIDHADLEILVSVFERIKDTSARMGSSAGAMS